MPFTLFAMRVPCQMCHLQHAWTHPPCSWPSQLPCSPCVLHHTYRAWVQQSLCPTSVAEAQPVPNTLETCALPPAPLRLLQTWDLDFVERWIKEHAADAARLGKPLLIEEFGKEVCFNRQCRRTSSTPLTCLECPAEPYLGYLPC